MKKINSLVLSTLTAAFLVGCGGGSSDGTVDSSDTSDTSVGGTVAIGLGISAQIEIMDVSTCEIMSTTSNSSGQWEYTGNLSSYTGPFLLKASSTLGFSMYSYIDLASGRVANITPFTHYSTDAASRASTANSIASMYASCNRDSGGLSQNINSFNSNLSTTLSNLRTSLSTNFSGNEYANANPFTVPFIADHSGYDALLDSTDISLNNNDTIIRIGSEILETSDADITIIPTMNITSKVENSTGNDLDDVIVSIDTRNTNISFDPITANTSSGSYSLINVDQYRDYVITYSKEGYTTVTQNYSTFTTGITPSTVVMFTTDETSTSVSPVTPTLNITDSRNGDTLSSVIIKIREGYNNRLGTVQDSVNSSDGSGLSLIPGTYTLELSKIGYENKYLTVTITSTTTAINADLLSINTSSTVNSNAFATIIVRWGLNPSDIDSHLLFNNTDVYFGNTSNGGIPIDKSNPCATSSVVASLDLDDTDSYGPETTTICDGTAGPFNFKLHHFSGSSNIGDSPTTVELITRDGSRYEFMAPTTGFTDNADDVWNVFTLNSDQSIIRTNTVDNTSTSLNNIINLTNNMFANKTYRLTDSTDNSYVVFEFYSDGTGKETGYFGNDSIEYTELIKLWSISTANTQMLNIVLSDNSTDSYYFASSVANGNIINVNLSNETAFNATLSNYVDVNVPIPSFVSGKTIVFTDNLGSATSTFNMNGTYSEIYTNPDGTCSGLWRNLGDNKIGVTCDDNGTTEIPDGIVDVNNNEVIYVFPSSILTIANIVTIQEYEATPTMTISSIE